MRGRARDDDDNPANTLKDFFIPFEDGCEKLTQGAGSAEAGCAVAAGGSSRKEVLDAIAAVKAVVEKFSPPLEGGLGCDLGGKVSS